MKTQTIIEADTNPEDPGRGSAFRNSTRSHKWAPDRSNEALYLIRRELIQLSGRLQKKADNMKEVNEDGAKDLYKAAHKLQQRHALTKVEPELKAHPRLTLREEDFDSDPYVLNTPAGLVDLRTGEVSPPDPAALCASATAVAPSEGRPERWQEVLSDAVDGDVDVVDWLQRLYGYGLTGLNVEKVLTLVFGPQDTSKTVVDKVTSTLAGDYHEEIPPGELFRQRREPHLTGIKSFVTSRLATSSEIKPRSTWRSEIVKAISGGDSLKVRGMYQDPKGVDPTCTMILYGNNLPSTNGVDPALVRRIVPVPFRHQIPEAEQDPLLAEKLVEEEGPQILAWMIRGAVEYFRRGLTPLPAKLQAEKEDYSEGEDLMSAFLSDRCVLAPDAEATTEDLRNAWRHWCNSQGYTEQANVSTVAFGRMFRTVAEDKGLKRQNRVGSDGKRGYAGIGVASSSDDLLQVVDGGA